MLASRRTFLKWTTGTMAMAGLGAACTGGRTTAGTSAAGDPATATGAKPGDGLGPTPGASPGEQKKGPPTLLILGGTGFLGPHLVEVALAKGYAITLFNRGKTNPHLFPDVEKLRGNRDGDLKALEGRRWDAVIDTSGYVPRVVRGSAELLAPSIGHYVFISTISVYGDKAVKGMDESYPVTTIADESNEDVRANYGALKALCEKAADAAMPGRVANIRPGLIVGPRDPTDRFTYWPVRVARGGEVLAPGTGDALTQYIDVRDLAEWTIHVVGQRITGVFNAVGPADLLSMRQYLETCKTVSGSDARLTWVDAEFLEQQKVAPWMDMPMWIPPVGDFAGIGTISRARAMAHGLTFRPLEDTVRATLAWFDEQPAERKAKLRAGLAPEREKEVLAAWHARKARPGAKKKG